MADFKEAMKSHDKVRQSTISFLRSKIKYAEIEKGLDAVLTDDDVVKVIFKEVKLHKESIEAFKQGNRPDLVTKEEAEMAILTNYLPRQMSREEIMDLVKKAITDTGAKGMTEKGKVMQKLMPQVSGKADGREVNNIV
ncbi:MAG: GatB/YqeY domain-containing protein, partial [Chloroflexi bacterium]|nr:GatB/YqeY domain-containing protein [Chloroflexota bacterium]